MLFFPWRPMSCREWRLICQHTNEDAKCITWSRHFWNFPRDEKDYSSCAISTGITYFQKQGNDFGVWSVLLYFPIPPSSSRPFPSLLAGWSLSLSPCLKLWVTKECFIAERMFYCCQGGMVTQEVGKGTWRKEKGTWVGLVLVPYLPIVHKDSCHSSIS